MAYHLSRVLFFALVLIFSSQESYSFSFGWGSASSSETHAKISNDHIGDRKSSSSPGGVALFSMESLEEPNGIKLVEDAKKYLDGPDSCWRNAYGNLFAKCSEILSDGEMKSRFAWELSDCFQKGSGRPSFPKCDSRATMQTCCKKLDDSEHKIYHAYYLETDSICYRLQASAFKYETERLVNDLKEIGESALKKLENIEQLSKTLIEKSKTLIDRTDTLIYQTDSLVLKAGQIDKSITSLDHQTQQVAETTKKVKDQMDVQLTQSNAVLQRSVETIESQSKLLEGQVDMKIEMGKLHENLNQNIERLKDESFKLGKEISENTIRMDNLQSKTNDVGNAVEISLDKQKLLLEGQSAALERLKVQSKALEDSKANLQTLADFSRRQQEELLKGQQQLQHVQSQLLEGSKSILEGSKSIKAAQDDFKDRQGRMIDALDKHFTLLNRILRDTRLIKAFCLYPFAFLVLCIATSFKRTRHMRGWVILGLAVLILLEISSRVYWYERDLDKLVWMCKNAFFVAAAIKLLHSAFTYRDKKVLDHQMLMSAIEKFNAIVATEERTKHMGWEMESTDDDDDIDFVTWVDEDLPEESYCTDPDFMLVEGVAESSITTSSISRKYDLRPRPSSQPMKYIQNY